MLMGHLQVAAGGAFCCHLFEHALNIQRDLLLGIEVVVEVGVGVGGRRRLACHPHLRMETCSMSGVIETSRGLGDWHSWQRGCLASMRACVAISNTHIKNK